MKLLPVVLSTLLVVAGCSQAAGSAAGPAGSADSSAPTLTATPAAHNPAPGGSTTPLTVPTGPDAVTSVAHPTNAQLIGQKLVVAMDGPLPSTSLLGRIQRGEVGGVILFGRNVTTRAGLIALVGQLRAAAVAGGQPHFLIAVDQEGGSIKRIPWAPPTMSAQQMGANGLASVAKAQGASTAVALKGLGIDVDFAPVADVPASTTSFMYRAHRTFSFDAARTAVLANEFAIGLGSGGVAPTMKHFPGIGYANRDTDSYVVKITASKTALGAGLRPYRTAVVHRVPLIMLSNATYTAYDAVNGAGWSHAISVTLLRHDLGFKGVTITDSLDGTAHARGVATALLAVRAALAGTDMILTTGSEATSRGIYAKLLAAANSGAIPRATLLASYSRILALKSAY